jgi:site-specific recombinase XerD
MKHDGLELVQLEPWHVDRLLERPFGTLLSRLTRYDYRGELLNYLQWLYERGDLGFDPSKLRRGRFARRVLPDLAEQFIAGLAVTLRPGTCKSYRTGLGRFCRWASEQGLELEQLDRLEVSRFFAQLHERGLHPTTRCENILQLRAYLRWLYERGLLVRQPELLIRRTDFPKCPQYLPRPIRPEADRELRARLAASSCRYQQGLLLMRNTGLRIGELITLEYDCLRTDLQGNSFLKVPLGKLNNERLVPLDAPTVRLVESIHAIGDYPTRPWLLATVSGARTFYSRYVRALRDACHGIDIDGRMTTHRLRHTYATTMLCGGMSLVGLMRLLGHRSYHTTLRYAAITQETIGREYFAALGQIEQRYQQQLQHVASAELDPQRLLADLSRWIDRHIRHEAGHPRDARRLLKRIQRVASEIRTLMRAARQP